MYWSDLLSRPFTLTPNTSDLAWFNDDPEWLCLVQEQEDNLLLWTLKPWLWIIHCFDLKAHDLLPPTTGPLRSLVTVFLSLAPPCIWLSSAPLLGGLPEDFGGGPEALCAGGGGGPGGGGGGGGIFVFYDNLTPPVSNIVFHLHGIKRKLKVQDLTKYEF